MRPYDESGSFNRQTYKRSGETIFRKQYGGGRQRGEDVGRVALVPVIHKTKRSAHDAVSNEKKI